MKWFKIDSDFYQDPEIRELRRQCKAASDTYHYILCQCATQWDGTVPFTFKLYRNQLQIDLNLRTNSIETHLKLITNLLGVQFKTDLKSVCIEFLFPKFLEKQNSFFRGACRKTKNSHEQLESELESDKEKEKKREECCEQNKVAIQAPLLPLINNIGAVSRPKERKPADPGISFDFNSQLFENITDEFIKLCCDAYPAVDFDAELNKMALWLIANPKNRKSNYAKFINSWLRRSQDRAPRASQGYNNAINREF